LNPATHRVVTRIRRRSDIFPPLIALVYVAIGTALVAASWLPWRAWSQRLPRPPAGDGTD
jgi:hypothetical protein